MSNEEREFEEHQTPRMKDVKVPKISLEEANEAIGLASEEQQQEDVAPEVTTELEALPDISEEEVQRAKKYGHKTKEEWVAEGRPEEEWKDARQYNEFGDKYPEFKKSISEIKEELAKKNKAIEYLVEAQKRQAEEAAKQARLVLERQLAQAKANGDIDAAINLTEQKLQLEKQVTQHGPSSEDIERTKIDQVFLERNPWFNKNNDYQKEAQVLGAKFAQENPGCSYASIAKHVEDTMKYLHQELSLTPAPTRRGDITSARSNINKTSSVDAEQTKAYKSLSASEQMDFKIAQETFNTSMEKYYKDPKTRPKYTLTDFLQAKSKANRRGE